jgi:molybdopterin molybdotransferase
MSIAPTRQDESDPNGLTVEQALERVLAESRPVGGTETLAIAAALDRVLAQPVTARIDVPPARNSAMDGYALRGGDGQAGNRLRLVGVSAAGHPWNGPVGPGECVRILTGAVVPEGADTVVMQEHVSVTEGKEVTLERDAARGAHIREPGEDTRAGTVILDAGRRLTAADIGLLASQGIGEVIAVRRPRVVFFTTGDELVPIGQPLGPGQIHDSNRYTLAALLTRYPVEFVDLGVIADTEEAVRSALTQAGATADLILTTGGVSVGDADYVSRLLQQEGQVGFWKVAMKPGRPLAFGRFGNALFLGLPGNPVSAMATFSLFVRPALLRLCGTAAHPPWTLQARLLEDLRKSPGRTDFQRGILEQRDGEWVVQSTGGQGSHQLRSMSVANAYIRLPADSSGARAGEQVEVIPFQSVF